MPVYPQLASGALGQFPIAKSRRPRTLVNRMADSRTVKLSDPAAAITEWRLDYSGLSDAEADSLRNFFEAVEGALLGFTFLDPLGNLLAWSEVLDEAVWTRGPLLTLEEALADPFGGTRATRLTNSGAGAQSIFQTLAAPGDYRYSLSVYARAAAPVAVTMLLCDKRGDRAVTDEWSRIAFSESGEAASESMTFGLEIPAASAVEVFGMQVEPQPSASTYKPSTTGGVFEQARFRDDLLAITATGVGAHACTVNIIHANHL